MFTIYLAGPLFTEAERDWLLNLKSMLLEEGRKYKENLTVIWPYELITEQEIESLGEKAPFEIFNRCKTSLDSANLLIALLDGTQVDDGTAWEIGYFYGIRASESKILGIRTDFRNAGESERATVNAMIEMACDSIVSTREDLISAFRKLLVS